MVDSENSVMEGSRLSCSSSERMEEKMKEEEEGKKTEEGGSGILLIIIVAIIIILLLLPHIRIAIRGNSIGTVTNVNENANGISIIFLLASVNIYNIRGDSYNFHVFSYI